MTRAVLAILVVGAALLQVGVVSTLVFHSAGAPFLPIALLAAWGTVRRPAEVWPALLLAAATLGVASEQRAGWYLLALLPTGIALIAPATLPTTSYRARGHHPSLLGGIARAPVAAAAGTWVYLVLLLVAGGDAAAIPEVGVDLVVGALWTGVVAAILAFALWPLRSRQRSLFA